MSAKKSAVCYLTRTPDPETIQFAQELAQHPRISANVDVYIMVDDNNYQLPTSSSVRFIQINNQECISNGYHSSNKLEMNKDCISWDKSLYFFCQIKRDDYAFVWILEDDSFVPSVDAFLLLHEKYSKEGNGDLICQKNDENRHGDTSTWKWGDVVGKFSPPWYHSMVCAIGCSRRLLDAIAIYVKQRRFLPFIEYMFNTIAMQNNFQVVNPPELSTIVFRENWTLEHVQQRPNNWFHPFKSGHVRQENRLRLAKAPQASAPSAPNTGFSQYQGQTPQYQWQGPQQQGQTPQYIGQWPQLQGQAPQYPYSMPPNQGTPPNNGGVISSLVYPGPYPPPYPPH